MVARKMVQRAERKLEQTVGDAFARIFEARSSRKRSKFCCAARRVDGIQSLQGKSPGAQRSIITLGVRDFEKLGADPELKSTGFARLGGLYPRTGA